MVAAAVEALDHPHDLPRLGESVEFGELLLQLVELAGWSLSRGYVVGQSAEWVSAAKPGKPLVRRAGSLSEFALPVFLECMRLDGRYMGAL